MEYYILEVRQLLVRELVIKLLDTTPSTDITKDITSNYDNQIISIHKSGTIPFFEFLPVWCSV